MTEDSVGQRMGLRQIVVATDRRYALPTAVTVRSLTMHDAGPFEITVLSSGVDAPTRRLVENSVAAGDVTWTWVDMEQQDLGDTSRGSVGRATYYRLAMDTVLAKDVTQVLYLDVDLLVCASLDPLWEIPDRGQVLSAVRSVNYPSICTYGAMDRWVDLGLDGRAPYFNAGVLMIDLERWREREVGRQCLDYLASPLANGLLADQEALNVVLSGSWNELEPVWNQQSSLLEASRGAELLYSDEILTRARTTPAIIHFIDNPKPWHRDCLHPDRSLWREVASATAFAPVTLDRTTTLDRVAKRMKRSASVLLKG